MIRVTVINLDRVLAELQRIGHGDLISNALLAGGVELAGRLRDDYPARNSPTRKSVYGTTFVSAKQRRYVMAAIKRGEIPYRRGGSKSENLGKRWIAEKVSPTQVIVGNNASYGPFVMGTGTQSRYMQAVGWHTTDEVADRFGTVIAVRIEKQIDEGIKLVGL